MKRVINGKTYTIEQEGDRQAVYEGSGIRRKFVGFAYKRAGSWYLQSAPENYGGGLMKDAMKSIMKGRKR